MAGAKDDAPLIGHNLEKVASDMEKRTRDAAANLEFEEAARLRDEGKRLKNVELAVMDDPLAKSASPLTGEGPSAIQSATASWLKPGQRKAGTKAGKPDTRAWRGPKR